MNNLLPGFIDSYPTDEAAKARIPMGRYGHRRGGGQDRCFPALGRRQLHHGAERPGRRQPDALRVMAPTSWEAMLLAALLVPFVVDLLAQLLDARSTVTEPPARLRSIYDPAAYARSQRYTRSSTRAGMIESVVELGAVLALVFGGGLAWLDRSVTSLALPSPVGGVLLLGVLVLLQLALQLPFVLWGTFVLEARFGFNRTTWRTFVLDGLKSLLLLALLGVPFAALVIVFFERAGRHAWWLSWLVAAVAALALQRLVPRWILPLFLRFEPLQKGPLRDAIEDWAARTDVALDGLYVVDGSRRSNRANAFVSGWGARRRIALFDTLIERLEPDEVVAVLAHEVGHDRLGHLRAGTLLSVLHLGALFYLLAVMLAQDGLALAFGLTPSVPAGLVFFALLFRPAELALGAAMGWLSRRFELQADRFAAGTVGAEPMVRALIRLGRDNLVNLTPHPLRVALHDSHPPLARRIAALEEG